MKLYIFFILSLVFVSPICNPPYPNNDSKYEHGDFIDTCSKSYENCKKGVFGSYIDLIEFSDRVAISDIYNYCSRIYKSDGSDCSQWLGGDRTGFAAFCRNEQQNCIFSAISETGYTSCYQNENGSLRFKY